MAESSAGIQHLYDNQVQFLGLGQLLPLQVSLL